MRAKKLMGYCTSLVLVVMLFVLGIQVQASGGNSIDEAESIAMGTTYSGEITEDYPVDYYTFTLSTSGTVTLKSSAYIYKVSYILYEADKEELWSDTSEYDENTGVSNYTKDLVLTSGTYYLAVSHYDGSCDDGEYGTYSFSLSFSSTGETFAEQQGGSNNSMSTASSIKKSTTYVGQIARNDTEDFYKFSLGKSAKVTLKGSTYFEEVKYYVYDAEGTELWSTSASWDSTSSVCNYSTTLSLTKGTYYILVKHSSGYGKYKLLYKASSVGESFTEKNGGSNNSISKANSISLNKTYTGQIALNDTQDFYKFKITKSQSVKLVLTAYIPKVYYRLYDSEGSQLYEYSASWNTSTEKSKLTETVTLSKGTYYLAVFQSSDYGKYKIAVKTSSSSSKVKISSVKSSSSKKITVKWKKVSGASSYQIAYKSSGSSKWHYKTVSKSKLSATISDLKSGKKYTVKVRAVKKVSGKKKYCSWSSTKKVTVK